MKNYLSLAQVASFLALLFIFLNSVLALALNNLFFLNPILDTGGMFIIWLGMFSFPGVLLGSVLCPFFLPTPERSKPLGSSIAFIVFLTLPNIILRSLDFEFFIDYLPIRAVVTFFNGMLFSLCYGLFFLTHLSAHECQGNLSVNTDNSNRFSRYCTFFFALAIAFHYLIPVSPILSQTGLTADPKKAMSLVYNGITWCVIGIALAAIISVLLLNRQISDSKLSVDKSSYVKIGLQEGLREQPKKTNWFMIFHLICLAIVFRILNAIMDLRLSLHMNLMLGDSYALVLIGIGLAIPIITLLVGHSIDRFIKGFLPPAIIMFILFTCLPLFDIDNYPVFILIMNIFIGLFNNLLWVFFTAALVQAYRGSFWFYGIAIAIYFTNFFTFIIYRFYRYIPQISTEFTVLLAGIAAVVFFLLSFRILFPKQSEVSVTLENSASISLEEILRKQGLTESEIEVAGFMVREGLNSDEIAKRILRATVTVKSHITSIYRKFNVKSRAEFMSLFVRNSRNDPDKSNKNLL